MAKTLTLVLLLCTCYAFAYARQVTVTGRIIDRAPGSSRVVKANFFNPIKHNGTSIRTGEDGLFSFTEDMLFAQDMTLNYDDYFLYLYVAPGDSVNVVIDAAKLNDDNTGWAAISGGHAALSTQLNKCIQYVYGLPRHTYNYDVPPAAMLDTVKADYARYMTLLQQYITKNKPLPALVQFIKKDIKYIISNNMADYTTMGKDDKDKQAHARLFADPFFDIYSTGSFASQMFPYHLGTYVYALTRANSVVNAAIAQKNYASAIHSGTSLLLNEPAGAARDYMMFKYLLYFASQSPGVLDSISDIEGLFTSKAYYNQLLTTVAAIKTPQFTPVITEGVTYLQNNADSTALPATDIIQWLVSQHPGKVIYIDVFATWCQPCLAEFKNVPGIHEALKDKNVAFAYLCLNSGSQATWKKQIEANHLQGSHFFFDADATKLFMGNYTLSGYPSYILINKQGHIVTINAPRPSAKEELVATVDRLLEE